MRTKNFLPILIIIGFLSSVTFAASPYFFNGYVHVNGSLAPNGTIVEVRVAGVNKYNVSVGEGTLLNRPQGWYVISFTADSGNNVTFQVNGLNLLNTNGTDNTTQTLTSSNIIENFNLSVNKSANTVACEVASGCTGGFCVHAICRAASTFCGDTFCDSEETCTSCSGDCGACPSSGSSGGGSGGSSGGGGGGGGAAKVTDTYDFGSVSAFVSESIPLATAKLPVTDVELTTTVAATGVKISVSESSAPSGVSQPISSSSGSVYKYIEIKSTGVTGTQISKAKIKFKVENSWLIANKIDTTTIKLNRLLETTWTQLFTIQLSKDSTYTYYEAETPGFSTFAITGEKVITAAPVCGNGVIEGSEECDTTNLAGQTCITKGYASGSLKCTDCRFDIGECVSAQPSEESGEEPASGEPSLRRPATQIPDVASPLVIVSIIIIIVIIIVYALWLRPKGKHQQYRNYEHPHTQ